MGNFKIKEFRKAKNLYQDEFAAIIGLTQSNLSRYENNGVDLTGAMLDKLRERFGSEIDAYMTDSAEQLREKSLPSDKKDDLTMLDLITIVKKQNETICQQVETMNDFMRQITTMNVRLLDLLDKIQFE